jgi:hypothetical protein
MFFSSGKCTHLLFEIAEQDETACLLYVKGHGCGAADKTCADCAYVRPLQDGTAPCFAPCSDADAEVLNDAMRAGADAMRTRLDHDASLCPLFLLARVEIVEQKEF